jgi:hypothetical protein
MEKKCTKCGETKSIHAFYNNSYSCKTCCKLRSKLWQIKYPNKAAARKLEWQRKNKEKVKKSNERWRKLNRDKCYEANKLWIINNHDKYKEMHRNSNTKRRSSPSGRIRHSISVSIQKALKHEKHGRAWESLVGYTLKTLIQHLEKRFTEGMSLSNHGKWHIDHIIPKTSFNYESTEDPDFKKCWALSNLQPLWASDNIKKSNKILTIT